MTRPWSYSTRWEGICVMFYVFRVAMYAPFYGFFAMIFAFCYLVACIVKIIETAVVLGTKIPSEVGQLKLHPGIGDTIAEKIVGYGFGKPALPLDSHGCKITARVGGLNESNAPCLRRILKDTFDQSQWMEVHELLRLDGQSTRSTPEKVINSWEKWRSLLTED